MIKEICPGWYEVTAPSGAKAWFRTHLECVIWTLSGDWPDR
jgi:hypothetical protein